MNNIKFGILLVSVLVISFVFSACDGMATLKIINDTNTIQNFVIRIDGEWETDKNGETIDHSIISSGTCTISRSPGFSYEIYRSRNSTTHIWNGSLSDGETVELKFSEAQ